MLAQIIALAVFGACIGSFLNVVILRLPLGQPLTGRSHCVSCKRQLTAVDLVPVVSWIALRGTCRTCKQSVSRRYFYVELFTAAITVVAYSFVIPHSANGWLILARDLAAIYVLIVVFMIDLEHFLILDSVLLWGGGIVALLSAIVDYRNGSSLLALGLIAGICAAAFFGLQYALSRGAWIGLGDVKFAVVIGLIAGFPGTLVALLLAYGIGAVVGLFLILFDGKRMSSEVPFGTFLSVGCLVAMFYGVQLSNWYLHVTGLK